MRWPLHLDLPHEWIASSAGAEADGFEKMKRHGIGASHEEPDAIECELLAAVIEYTQQEPLTETQATKVLMKKDRQLGFRSPLGRTKHGVAHDVHVDLRNELLEALLTELSQPRSNL
jgi:ethanolamine utilization cobalamin adenosyltransferase